MIYLDLLVGFLKVGCFAFGGAYAAIPLIREVVLSYGWISDEMLSYMIAVSESTPGPIMVNLATYVGSSQAGILGSLLATIAVVLPSLLLTILLSAVLARVLRNPYVDAVLKGLRPCIMGIILATGCYMTFKALCLSDTFSIDWKACAITLFLAIIYFGIPKYTKKSMSPILLIVIAAMIGMIVY